MVCGETSPSVMDDWTVLMSKAAASLMRITKWLRVPDCSTEMEDSLESGRATVNRY
jgi:hypothetical protein